MDLEDRVETNGQAGARMEPIALPSVLTRSVIILHYRLLLLIYGFY